MSTQDTIKQDISQHDVILYMKGTADKPMCGFSGAVVQIFKKLGVIFKDVDVLSDPELREGIKTFSDWPTIPQLYIKQEFIGGCDIVREMYRDGELQKLLKEKGLMPLTDHVSTVA